MGASRDFYPRSPCGERPGKSNKHTEQNYISIHALLAESDPLQLKPPIKSHDFYPRSPCGERPSTHQKKPSKLAFLSTLSLRRATAQRFSTLHNILISIHALLAESDIDSSRAASFQHHFYPRSPCGERPLSQSSAKSTPEISIHALLAESDNPPSVTPAASRNFYPRSPCGERLVHALKLANAVLFLSTLSLRRATAGAIGQLQCILDFYPRSPCGERHSNFTQKKHPLTISIHALLAESDRFYPFETLIILAFLSTLSLRRATSQRR